MSIADVPALMTGPIAASLAPAEAAGPACAVSAFGTADTAAAANMCSASSVNTPPNDATRLLTTGYLPEERALFHAFP